MNYLYDFCENNEKRTCRKLNLVKLATAMIAIVNYFIISSVRLIKCKHLMHGVGWLTDDAVSRETATAKTIAHHANTNIAITNSLLKRKSSII